MLMATEPEMDDIKFNPRILIADTSSTHLFNILLHSAFESLNQLSSIM